MVPGFLRLNRRSIGRSHLPRNLYEGVSSRQGAHCLARMTQFSRKSAAAILATSPSLYVWPIDLNATCACALLCFGARPLSCTCVASSSWTDTIPERPNLSCAGCYSRRQHQDKQRLVVSTNYPSIILARSSLERSASLRLLPAISCKSNRQ